MAGKRRVFGTAFKAKVALAAAKGDLTKTGAAAGLGDAGVGAACAPPAPEVVEAEAAVAAL